MLEPILEMKMRCNPYWSTVSAVRAHVGHADVRARAGAGVGWWAGGGGGLL